MATAIDPKNLLSVKQAWEYVNTLTGRPIGYHTWTKYLKTDYGPAPDLVLSLSGKPIVDEPETDEPETDEPVDGRKAKTAKFYSRETLEAWVASRPGKGNHTPRKSR